MLPAFVSRGENVWLYGRIIDHNFDHFTFNTIYGELFSRSKALRKPQRSDRSSCTCVRNTLRKVFLRILVNLEDYKNVSTLLAFIN